MIAVAVLVVAKAPVPGLAKTRLAASIGESAAADYAAAALLDTLDAVTAAPVAARVVALTGDLAAASRSAEIETRLADFTVLEQRGADFADRLANAHADAAAAADGLPVLQIGMDTPQVTADLLAECATALCDADAVLGMARDGGWWVLGVTDPAMAECLREVPMSRPRHRRCNASRPRRHRSGRAAGVRAGRPGHHRRHRRRPPGMPARYSISSAHLGRRSMTCSAICTTGL